MVINKFDRVSHVPLLFVYSVMKCSSGHRSGSSMSHCEHFFLHGLGRS